MLNERRARTLRRDPGQTVLEVGGSIARTERRDATVLLDAAGDVVGVDLRDDDARGYVVMAGAHESVRSTRPSAVEVGLTAQGEIASVVISA